MLRRTKTLAMASLVGACALVGGGTAQAGPIQTAVTTVSGAWVAPAPVQIGTEAPADQIGKPQRGFYIAAPTGDAAKTANTVTGPKSVCVFLPPPGGARCGGAHGMQNFVLAGNTYGSDSYFIVRPEPGAAQTTDENGVTSPCPADREINLRWNVTLVRHGGGGELHVNWDIVAPNQSAQSAPGETAPGPTDPYQPKPDADDGGIDFDGAPANGISPFSQSGPATPDEKPLLIDFCG